VKLKITIDNKIYEVEVEAAEPEVPQGLPGSYVMHSATVRVPAVPAASAPVAANGGPVNEEKVCRSPISGIVVRVVASQGQQIQTGDTLLVLEAMKMETNITAPAVGKIARVNAAEGDSVQGGQILIEFE
jgi:methylmalonyl-CoA carboxyltransferase small subunit